ELQVADIFVLENSLLELLVRGTILYFAFLVIMRFIPRRTTGDVAMMDLVFLLLIVEAAAHGVGQFSSITDGIVLIVVLIGWNYIMNFLSYRLPVVERLITQSPLPVVRNGEMVRRNMRREFLTEEELMHSLRRQGFDDIKDVKEAYLEGEGDVTAI